jgi:hypothetical protein
MAPRSRRDLWDLIVAVLVGLIAELSLAALSIYHCCDITEDYPWPHILQNPGTEISLRVSKSVLRSYSGPFEASVLAIVLQALIFALMTLGLLYIWRMFKNRPPRGSGQQG